MSLKNTHFKNSNYAFNKKKYYFSDNHSKAVRRLDPTDVFSKFSL